jgi:PAS domain S-box-containing protein
MNELSATGRGPRQDSESRGGEEQYRAILESITDAFYAIDRDWRFTYVNSKAETLMGRGREELLGQDVWRLYSDAIGSEFHTAYHRAMDEKVAVSFEAYYPPQDRWYELHAYPSADGISVYFRDINERKRSEEEKTGLMAASEKQRRIYETALSSTPDFLYIFDLDGRFIYVNDALLSLWRKTLDEALGRGFLDLDYPPELAERLNRQIRQVIETGQPVKDETPYTSHRGEREYEYIFVPVLGAGGAVEAVAGSTRDITERRRHESDLQASRQFLASSIDALTAHIAVLDEEGVILMVNGAWRRFAAGNAYSAGDCGVGTNYLNACEVDGDDHCQGQRAAAGIREVLGGRAMSFEMEYPCHGPDERRWFLMRATRFESARSVRAVIAHENITERKRAEEQLQAAKDEAEAANRAKDQFLAILSHELRTPLNPILLAASSMLEHAPEPDDLRPTLEMIRQNVNLQARLIDDLLDVMRIVQGKMPLHWGVSDFHALIHLAMQVCRSQINGQQVRLVLDLAAEHHHVNGDSARLQQVLWNLLKNAAKFTPVDGTVTVRTRNVDDPVAGLDRLVVEVADTGIGIGPDILPTIFDPFQQGETTVTRRFGGLGLGLAICKGIVDAHGGTLTAESPGKDRGAIFRVELKTMPDPDGEPKVGRQGEAPDAGSISSSLSILVVEDEPATLRLMARLLRGLGHEVTTANTVAGALEAERGLEFDLIISDIGLPDGSGLELMRRITARRGAVPAIALTGYGMEDDILRSREAGFTSHMTKPIDFTKLGAMIRQVAPTHGGSS